MPSPPRIGLGVSPSTVQPARSRKARTPATRLGDGGGVADDAALADAAGADLELRLDERDEGGAGAGERERRRQRLGERDEREVGDDEVGRRHVAGGEVAGVQALDRVHPRVGGERRRELAVADVDGPDLGGAAGEQDLGEAAGRGAEVERDGARRVEAEDVERVHELQRAARDPGVRVGVDGRGPRRTARAAAGRVAGAPSTRTTPASISARARARRRGEAGGDQRLVEPQVTPRRG